MYATKETIDKTIVKRKSNKGSYLKSIVIKPIHKNNAEFVLLYYFPEYNNPFLLISQSANGFDIDQWIIDYKINKKTTELELISAVENTIKSRDFVNYLDPNIYGGNEYFKSLLTKSEYNELLKKKKDRIKENDFFYERKAIFKKKLFRLNIE